MSGAYYNEIDPYAAQWLRNLIAAGHIADGDVDERSILDVEPDDLRDYTQCHFFAGIAGWSYALRLAGWPDDRLVWTGSCPCQPFSSAARGKGKQGEDARHLWPYWKQLIAESAPGVILGEQVADAGAWLDEVCDDLEGLGYAFGATVLPACCVGHDHVRPRIYFAGYANGKSKPGRPLNGKMARMQGARGFPRGLASPHGVPARVAKLRAAGNAIVPQVAAEVIRAVM